MFIKASTIANFWYQRTILHTPFAPFFVVLRHVLETLSIDDLVLLQEFIESLSHALDVSNRLKRFHQLCHVMCEVAGLFVGVKLKLNNSSVTVPEMPQALDNVNELLHQQFSIGQPPPPPQELLPTAGAAAPQEQQAQQYVKKQVPGTAAAASSSSFQQQQQSLGNVLQEAPPPAVVVGGDASMATLPLEWDPLTMGTMDWMVGYENILNLMQDELQLLENYPNAGLF